MATRLVISREERPPLLMASEERTVDTESVWRVPHIVVVDDDDAVRFAIGMLVEAIGWRTSLFASARQVLGSGCLDDANCLVLDLQMPEMTGADLIELLRRQQVAIPVIVITAFADNGLARRARAAGALAVLRKPFDSEVLLDVIRQSLGPVQ